MKSPKPRTLPRLPWLSPHPRAAMRIGPHGSPWYHAIHYCADLDGWKTQCLSSTWDKSMAMTCNKWPKPTPHTATVAKNPFRWTVRIVYRVYLMKLIETCTTFDRLPSLFITFTLKFLAHLGESSTKQYQTAKNGNQKQWKLLGSTLHTCPSWRNNSTSCVRRDWKYESCILLSKNSQLVRWKDSVYNVQKSA